MKIARTVRVVAMATAGVLAVAGAASAAPALNLGAETGTAAATEATPVNHYGSYYNGYYHNYYQPYYAPYGYAPYGYAPPPPRPRYYAPYGYQPYGHYGYRRPHSGLYIRTPGLRLGIGF